MPFRPEALVMHREGHHLSINSVGWGEPLTIYTRCTCGWQGITLHEPWSTNPDDNCSYLAEPYRSVAQTYGIECLLDENEADGDLRDAVRLALDHVGYDPDVEEAQARAGLIDATATLHATATRPDVDTPDLAEAAAPVNTALRALRLAMARRDVWEAGPVPVAPERNPEGVRLIAEIRNQQHA